MTPEVTDFIPGSLEDTDEFIEVADGHHVTAKQKSSVRIQMCDDNGKKFVATFYNVLNFFVSCELSSRDIDADMKIT